MADQPTPRVRRKIWSSITFKLTVAFAFVSILGIVLVAYFIQQRAKGEFDHYVKIRTDGDMGTRLADYYAANQSWGGVSQVFVAGEETPKPKAYVDYTVVDSGHEVVYGTGEYTVGTPVGSAVLDEAIPILDGGEVVGWLVVDGGQAQPPREGYYSPENDYMTRMTNAVVMAALIATVVAVVIGASLARTLSHPIQELTEATRKVARGVLGFQVSVHTNDELGTLAESFNHMSADLAQATNMRRQMTADIAHELRSPLSVILGYAEALSEAKLHGSPDIFQSIHLEARHLQRLIDDLRLLSLADAGELPLSLQFAPPKFLLEQVRMSYASQASRNHVSLSVDAPDDLPEIYVDPDRMAQVLGNLVNNALRYTAVGGEIVLSAARAGDGVNLRVKDNGAGISKENLRHIFDRFYRGDESRFSQSGESGLGLAIARSIVEAHRGEIAAESVEGEGTTFVLRMPTRKV